MWYWRTRDFPFGAARRRTGDFVFMDKGRGVVEVTAADRQPLDGTTEAFEVTSGGDLVWHLAVSGPTTMLRVEPLRGLFFARTGEGEGTRAQSSR